MKSVKKYVVTAVNVGDTCDGHAVMCGIFATREKAEEYVREDMKDCVRAGGGVSECDFVKHEVWQPFCHGTDGCIWDIHEIKMSEDECDDPIVDGKPEDATAIHNAIMAGLDAKGIRYESDGESYWVDCQDGDTRYIGVDVCAD